MTEAVLLVGHGGVPGDMPREWLAELRRLRQRGAEAEAAELEQRIRRFPRSDATDPYGAGLRALAAELRARAGERSVAVAYNELCSPSIAEAIAALAAEGATKIVVFTTMITPGGSHSERDLPEAVAAARAAHPGVVIDYVWPLDLGRVADMFAAHIR
jgi:sirohydrochlorin cobaltochelatase